MLRQLFKNMKQGTEHLNRGRHIIRSWGANHVIGLAAAQDRSDSPSSVTRSRPIRVLDLGCGHGNDLSNVAAGIRELAGARSDLVDVDLHGFESYPPYVDECRALGIEVHAVDLERDVYPCPEGGFDLVIANQILEHTKELFWIVAETARIMQPGARFIVGVPNLASLHNRLLLLVGQQPTCIQNLSAHVRGFTVPDLRAFVEHGGFFRMLERRGSNFYPFPPVISRPLSRLLPAQAWGIFLLFERTERQGSFLSCLEGDENLLQTPFYGGPQNPAVGR